MKKTIFTTAVFVLLQILAFQMAHSQSKVFPPSPLVQNFRKVTEIPVTEYNGMASIEIPLYEIKIKGLSIPVKLTYYGGGIKHDQYDGDVGVGWNMSAGGYQLNRTLCGTPDEKYDFFDMNTFDYTKRDAYYASYYPSTGWVCDKIKAIHGCTSLPYADGEYDLFQYTLPSTNGHFLFTKRTRPFTIQQLEGNQDIISLDPNSSAGRADLNEIVITDDKGFQYRIGQDDANATYSETVYTDDYGACKSSWPLTKITSPYNETVRFSYFKDLTQLNTNTSATLDVTLPSTRESGIRLDNEGSYAYRYQYGKYTNLNFINEIISNKETVKFIRFTTGDYKNFIQEIVITNVNSQVIKRVLFNYTKQGNHRMLEKVIVQGDNIADKEVYKMEYYAPAVASPGYSSAPDQWGYYALYDNNGKQTPVFLHNDFANDPYNWSYNTFKQLNEIVLYSDVVFTNKTNNTTPPVYYALKKLIYPTTGETELRYESNKFMIDNQVINGGGIRIREIVSRSKLTQDSTKTIYKYGLAENGLAAEIPNPYLIPRTFKREQTYKNIIYRDGTSTPQDVLNTHVVSYSVKPYLEYFSSLVGARYNQVAKYTYQPGASINKTVSVYNVSNTHQLGLRATNSEVYVSTYNYTANTNPLISRTVYNEQNQVVNKTEHTSSTLKSSSYISNRPFIKEYYESSDFYTGNDEYFRGKNIFENLSYSIRGGKIVPNTESITQYDLSGNNPVITTKTYEYDSQQRLSALTEKADAYPSDAIRTQFSYPGSGALVERNMISTVIKQQTWRNNIAIGTESTIFPFSAIVPSGIQTSASDDASLRDAAIYTRYDDRGNLLEYRMPLEDDVNTVLLWSYNKTYPVAEIKNATYAQVESYLTSAWINSLASAPYPAESIFIPLLENLKSALPSASVTIYIYNPLIGIKKIIDPSGKIQNYEYDTLGRLKNVKDMYGNLINEYQYSLTNQ